MITRSGPSPVEPALEQQRSLPAVRAPRIASRADRAAWFEALHQLSRLLPSRPLTAPVLLDAAVRQTGHSDFGARFGDVEVALGAWLAGLERAGSVDPLGRAILALETGWMLRSRLGVTAAVARRPAILDEPIRRPLFILGLPRSGTTLLHRLLATGERCRAPLTWELRRPEPPPAGAPDHRMRDVRRQLRAMLAIRPDFLSIHPIAADQPEECAVALHHTFLTTHCHAVVRAPAYLAWLRSQDLRPAYHYHRALLQLLQHGRASPQWVLKSPAHLYSLDALLDIYPDAVFVHLHRNLLEAAPSGCSLTTASRCITARSIERQRLGGEWLDNWGDALERGLRARERVDPARILDVRYEELVADPARLVRRVWRHFGIAEPADLERIVERHRQDHVRGRFGGHRYTLAEFGLEAGRVRERFAEYIRRFRLDTA